MYRMLAFLTVLATAAPLAAQPSVYPPRDIGLTQRDILHTTPAGRRIATAHGEDDAQDGLHIVYDADYVYYDLIGDTVQGPVTLENAPPALVANAMDDAGLVATSSGGIVSLFRDSGEGDLNFNPIRTLTGRAFSAVNAMGSTIVLTAVDTMLVSHDDGVTWNGGHLPELSPDATGFGNRTFWPAIDRVTTTRIAVAYTETDNGVNGLGSLWWALTTDDGQTWTKHHIYDAGEPVPGGGYYLPANFSQLSYVLDGYLYLAFNGYGIDETGSRPIFPIVYWDSDNRDFVELTPHWSGRPTDPDVINALVSYRSGNGIGNAYPVLSLKIYMVTVAWQQWERTANGRVRTVLPAGAADSVFTTDIQVAAGITYFPNFWDLHPPLGQPGVWEGFPSMPAFLGHGDDIEIVRADIAWLVDTNPGASELGQSDPSECIWQYQRIEYYMHPLPAIDRVSDGRPARFDLAPNWPNPFNPSTTVEFGVRHAEWVTLTIYDVRGGEIATLVDEQMSAGRYRVTWDGRDSRGRAVASGMYLYRLEAGGGALTRKMLLVR